MCKPFQYSAAQKHLRSVTTYSKHFGNSRTNNYGYSIYTKQVLFCLNT